MTRARLLCGALVAALASAVLVAAPAQAATSTISGVVRDTGGDRFSGMTIQAYADDSTGPVDQAVSAADGSYSLSVERGKVVRLGVSLDYYNVDLEMRSSEIALTGDRVEDFYIPYGGSVLSSVVEGDDGTPVRGAKVESPGTSATFTTPTGLVIDSELGPTRCWTGDEGTCHLLALSKGDVASVKITPPGRPAENFAGIHLPTQITPHTFTLAPAPRISGVLHRQDGTPLVGAEVRLVGSTVSKATSGPDGSWSLRSTPGTFRIDVTGTVTEAGWTFPYEFESATFDHQATRTVDLTLPAVENRRIVVLDSAGAALAGVHVAAVGDLSVAGLTTQGGLAVTAYLARSGTPGAPTCALTNTDGQCALPAFDGGSDGAVRVYLPFLAGSQDFPGSPIDPGDPRETTVRLAGYAVAASDGSVSGPVRGQTTHPVDLTAFSTEPITLPSGMDAVVGAVGYRVALPPGVPSAEVQLTLPFDSRPNALLRVGPGGALTDISSETDFGWLELSFTVVDGSLWDEDGVVNGSVSGRVVPAVREPLRVETVTLPPAAKGSAYSATLTGSGPVPPYTWELTYGQLPPGVVLSPNGSLTGTPTTLGSYFFYVRMRESTGGAPSAEYPLRLEVVPMVVTTSAVPDAFVGKAYSTTLKASSGGFLTWRLAGGGLPPGFKLSTSGVLSGTPTTTGSFEFFVNVTANGVTSPTRRLTVVLKPMEVATAALPDAPIGVTYSQKLTANGGKGTLAWTIANGGLPPGLTLSSAGTISGGPTTTGSFLVTVKVTDQSVPKQSATRTLIITVTPMTITTSTLPDAKKGQYYAFKVAASGGKPTLAWSVVGGSLPTGLTMSAAGNISGYPKTPGTWTFTVKVADSSVPKNTATRTFSITVT